MNISGWSFCIVSAKNNKETLAACIRKILSEFKEDPNFEILAVGQDLEVPDELKSHVSIVNFQEEIFALSFKNVKTMLKEKKLRRLFYKTGAISHKKNLAARMARFDKLCIMHDYIGIEEGWKAGFEKIDKDWNVAVTRVENQNGQRHRDWMTWDYPGVNQGLLPYHAYTPYMYISGAYFCVKRAFYLENTLDERLFWGDAEDVEWSIRVRSKTKFVMNTFSLVRYLKLKSLDDAPYKPNWIEATKKLNEIFKDPA
jgi:glycosyltransferase involved in cell wall biosynthesis